MRVLLPPERQPDLSTNFSAHLGTVNNLNYMVWSFVKDSFFYLFSSLYLILISSNLLYFLNKKRDFSAKEISVFYINYKVMS